MEWQPASGTQLLAPFDHQVAGSSSMLRYDTTTVCKPLIGREHFVYKTLPEELKEFTPEYRGEIEVQLVEEDGYIQLYGLSVDNDAQHAICSCSTDPDTPNQEDGTVKPQSLTKPLEEPSGQNRCMIRVLRSGSYEVCPATDEVFYTKDSNTHQPHTHSLNPWSLKNHKRLLDKMRKSEHSHNKIRFMMLKNVVADFRHPCILDLKIGSRLHGDDASHVKVASQSKKCMQTTSSTLGVRLCGMQVYQVHSGAYRSVDKFHGRTLNDGSFRDTLYDFLHNGIHLRTELIQPIVRRLSELIACLQGLPTYRFYASSLLIIYDGDVSLGGSGASPPSNYLPATAEPPPIQQVENLFLSARSLRQAEVSEAGNELSWSSVESSDYVPWPSASTAVLHHSISDLASSSVKESHCSGEVPTLLPAVSSITNLSQPHSCPKVPRNFPVDSMAATQLKEQERSTEVGMKQFSSRSVSNTDPHLKDKKNSSRLTASGASCENEDLSTVLSECGEEGMNCCAEALVDIKMIDFAHTTHRGFMADKVRHEGPDTDYIQGLQNLKKLFEDIKEKC